MSILRRLFGPSRHEVWRQLADQIGASFVDGGFWKGDTVVATHGEWTVTLDSYAVSTGKVTVVYTRMRAPYINPDGFRFTTYRRGMFSEVGKWFGMQDVEIGDETFDRAFIVKGNDDAKLRTLFGHERIRALVSEQPEIKFSVQSAARGWFGPKYPEDVDELFFEIPGVIKDVERLRKLYELFAETLDQLTRMGSAYERAPTL